MSWKREGGREERRWMEGKEEVAGGRLKRGRLLD